MWFKAHAQVSVFGRWSSQLLGGILGLFIFQGNISSADAQDAQSPSADTQTETSQDPAQASEEVSVDISSLEEQVNALKEKVFESKARLVLLRETVLNGVISGARAIIIHRNEMGGSFFLKRATYSLDGEQVLERLDMNKEFKRTQEVRVFEGNLTPGTHNIMLELVYKGNGRGVFTYLDDYQFKIRSNYPFTAEEGKILTIKAVAFERGDLTTNLQERPAIRFETEAADAASLLQFKPSPESSQP